MTFFYPIFKFRYKSFKSCTLSEERPTIKSQVDNLKSQKKFCRKKVYNNKVCCQASIRISKGFFSDF